MNSISYNLFGTGEVMTIHDLQYIKDLFMASYKEPTLESDDPIAPLPRQRKMAKDVRKSRASPSGEDKRWTPPEKIKTIKGSPADQKAKKIAMDIKRQRKWIEPFLAEPLCHDLVIHNKKKPEWIPPKKVRVRKPIYDKPCGGVVANYCINKWPTCPSQSMTDIYIAPRWPIFN